MSATPDESLSVDNFFSASLTSDITASSTDIPMDSIPTSGQGFLVIDPDSASNREVIFYNSKTALKVVCPSVADGRGQDSSTATSHTSGTTVIMAPVKGIIAALQSLAAMTLDAKGGWISALGEGESWSYSSYDSTNKTGVITVPSDATTQFTVGMRVRFTNNSSTQYGIITKITATTLTVYFGTDYSLTNSAITAPYYSAVKAPLGFPVDPAKWTVTTTSNSGSAKASPVSGTWYGDTALSATGPNISIPIGAWNVSYQCMVYTQEDNTSASRYIQQYVTLSTSTNSESDTGFSSHSQILGAANANTLLLGAYHHRSKLLALTSATTYYLLYKQTSSATPGTGGIDAGTPITIRAVCAYL